MALSSTSFLTQLVKEYQVVLVPSSSVLLWVMFGFNFAVTCTVSIQTVPLLLVSIHHYYMCNVFGRQQKTFHVIAFISDVVLAHVVSVLIICTVP